MPGMHDQRPRYVMMGLGFGYDLDKARRFDRAEAEQRAKSYDVVIRLEDELKRIADSQSTIDDSQGGAQ